MRNRKERNIQIGDRLRQIRRGISCTGEQFAEALDVGPEHYRKLEGGTCGLTLKNILKLYEIYGIDPTYLLTGNHPKVDVEAYLTNCSLEEKSEIFEKVFGFISGAMKRNIDRGW